MQKIRPAALAKASVGISVGLYIAYLTGGRSIILIAGVVFFVIGWIWRSLLFSEAQSG